MIEREYNLAIETSGRSGSVSLGRGDEVIDSAALPHKRRHNVELTPTIDALCRRHGVTPGMIGQVYVSLGPGSFTGLRVGVTTAKMLALAGGGEMKVFGIPTLDVLAENAPSDAEHVAVCLNLKRGTVHCAVYKRDGDGWSTIVEPGLRTLDELLDKAPRPASLIGEKLPEPPEVVEDRWEGVTVLGHEFAEGRSEAVYKLGRRAAAERESDDPMKLVPLYVREPEAVTLWEEKSRKTEN